jgi:hypothetical protein
MNNQLNIIGYVGQNPRIVTFPDTGNKVVKFSIGVREFSSSDVYAVSHPAHKPTSEPSDPAVRSHILSGVPALPAALPAYHLAGTCRQEGNTCQNHSGLTAGARW